MTTNAPNHDPEFGSKILERVSEAKRRGDPRKTERTIEDLWRERSALPAPRLLLRAMEGAVDQHRRTAQIRLSNDLVQLAICKIAAMDPRIDPNNVRQLQVAASRALKIATLNVAA
jgi:hypothetical protein